MRKRDFARLTDKVIPTPEEFENIKERLHTDFEYISADGDRPRAKDPANSLEQCAAQLGLTPKWFNNLIKSGELPPTPSPRAAGDRYERACRRAFRSLTPARRRVLQARSEREPA
jgi:hypothetical protein